MFYAINVDWLQVFCADMNDEPLNVIYNGKSSFDFKLLPHTSRQFSEIWNVYDIDGEHYAVIQRKPFSSIISKDGAIIQLVNRELYKTFWASEFIVFMAQHHFRFKSISRIDICFDSNTLYGGLRHSNLIKKLLLGEFLKNNQARIRENWGVSANTARPMECNSISFGSKGSAVSTKIYNKSLEMREVKNKPYIVECWHYNGIDCEQDVWRCEISIKSDANKLIRYGEAEPFRITPHVLDMQHQIEELFYAYAEKYFDIKKNNGTKNKTRMPQVKLFPSDRKPTIRPVRITNEHDSSRSDRIFLKKLHSLLTNMRNIDSQTENAIWEVSNAFVLSRQLSAWRQQKLLADADGHLENVPNISVILDRLRIIQKDLEDVDPIISKLLSTHFVKLFETIKAINL